MEVLFRGQRFEVGSQPAAKLVSSVSETNIPHYIVLAALASGETRESLAQKWGKRQLDNTIYTEHMKNPSIRTAQRILAGESLSDILKESSILERKKTVWEELTHQAVDFLSQCYTEVLKMRDSLSRTGFPAIEFGDN